MCVLVTGGAGYVGSHAVRQLLQAGLPVVVVDDLSRGHRAAVPQEVDFVEADIRDKGLMVRVLREHGVRTVMHFAGFSDVGESMAHPELYRWNNVGATARLLSAMDRAGVHQMVFSSSCVTYGVPDDLPVSEGAPQRPLSIYGETKLVAEFMLRQRFEADPKFAYVVLRYFNAAGCASDGSLGEDRRPQTRLIPQALQAALGQREEVVVFGDDYDTPDGTCIRDYVHVDDIARAHVQVLAGFERWRSRVYNIGLGRGYSVHEVLNSVERVTGRRFPVRVGKRRRGDAPALFADCSRIRRELGWEPEFVALDDIIETAWRWFRAHPNGYETSAVPAAHAFRRSIAC